MAEDDFIKRSKLALIQKISGTHLWKSDDGFKAWETLCEVCESGSATASLADLWLSNHCLTTCASTPVGYTLAGAPLKATNPLADAKMIRWQPVAG